MAVVVGVALVVAVGAYAFTLVSGADSQRNARLAADISRQDAVAYSKDVIGFGYESVDVSMVENGVEVHLVGPGLTGSLVKSTFNLDASRLVPNLFANFPSVQEITLKRDMPIVNEHAQLETRQMISMQFSRGRAASIDWPATDLKNVPTLADSYSESPQLQDQ